MRARRAGLGLLLAAGLAATAWAAPAQAAALLADADAAELANALAEATEAQGVCYGWAVTVDDVGSTSTDVGSHRGPGVRTATGRAACPNGSAELVVDLTYTSELSEAEDSASWRVIATPFSGARVAAGLRDLGFGGDDLLGDEDDVALANMAGAMPAIVAEVAGLPYVPFEPSTAPAEGRPTGSPGSDFLRENGWTLGLGLVLVLGGLAWWWAARRRRLLPAPTRPSRSSA